MTVLRLYYLFVVASIPFHTSGSANSIYVKPTESTECPGSPCYTFSEILSNSSQYFASNTQLLFLSGTNIVSSDEQLLVTQVSDLVLQGGVGSHNQSVSTIYCSGSFGLAFAGASNLTISKLTFLHCGALLTEQFVKEGGEYTKEIPGNGEDNNDTVSAALSFIEVTRLNISGVSVVEPNGYGVWAVNILGNSTIEDSLFTNGSSNF